MSNCDGIDGDFRLYPHTIAGIKVLNELDIPVFIVTNQSGVTRGTLKHSQHYAITAKMLRLFEEEGIKITRVYECLHGKNPITCQCRKPGTGMIDSALREYNIEPGNMFLVGDLATDVEMALNAGLIPIMVKTGLNNKEERTKAINHNKREVDSMLCIDDGIYEACLRIRRLTLDSTS